MTEQSPLKLGKRERQPVEAVYRLGEASVAQVLAELPDPPSYSSVHAMLSYPCREDNSATTTRGKAASVSPAPSKESARRSTFCQLLRTFFSEEQTAALATLLDLPAGQLTADDLERMMQLIENTRQKNG